MATQSTMEGHDFVPWTVAMEYRFMCWRSRDADLAYALLHRPFRVL